MKKRIISLILASAMLVSLTSCSKKEKKIAYQEGMTLEEYIDKVELPENLTISIDPATVTDQTTVYTYDQVEFMNFDAETLKEYFLQNPVTEEFVGVAGTTLENETEYLNILDGGVAFTGQVDNSGNGGFCYATVPERNRKWAWCLELCMPQYLDIDFSTVWERDLKRQEYKIGEDVLDFASREEISDKAMSFFQAFQIPNMEVHEILAYNLDCMQELYDLGEQDFEYTLLYNPELAEVMGKTYLEESGIYEPTKNDENYWALCRQRINDIPVDTYESSDNVFGLGEVETPWRTPSLQLQYTEKGLVYVNLKNLIQQPSQNEGTDTEILSASAALEKVRENYGQGILLEPHEIESLELVYRLYWSDEEKVASLKPFWLARVSYPIEAEITTSISLYDAGAPAAVEEIKGYDHLYFDAITGEYWDGSTLAKR